MDKFFKIIRVITVAPVLATALMLTLLIRVPEVMDNYWVFGLSILFLTVLPLTAYPMQKYIPHFKDGGRPAQRMLAMWFAVAGYILCCITGIIFKISEGLWIVYLEYLLCGLTLLVFNKGFRLKLSGHACGVTGPAIMLLHFRLFPEAAVVILLTIIVYAASIKTKRHTLLQLLGGSIVSVGVYGLLYCVFLLF